MEDAVTLSARLRRASPLTQRRMLAVLFALRQCTRKNDITFSLASVTTVLEFVMSGKPVRFLFATGGNASVLRSHDRGNTWRVIYRVKTLSNNCEVQKEEEEEGESPSGNVDSIDDVDKFLLSPNVEKGKMKRHEHPAVATETELLHITTLGTMVAISGSNTFLAVSADSGMSFRSLERNFIDSCVNCEAFSLSKSWQVGGLAFLSENKLLFCIENQLFVVHYTLHHLDSILFQYVNILKTFPTTISYIKTYHQLENGIRELFVSTRDILHYSYDGGCSFLAFPHQLGILRAVEPIDMVVRRCEIPQLPKEFSDFMLSSTEDNRRNKKLEKYSYRALSCYKCSSEEVNDNGHILEGFTNQLRICNFLSSMEKVHYRVFLVSGVGSPILPYDYTALLFTCVTLKDLTGQPHAIGSLAQNVEYIPYIRSGPSEPISIAMCRRPGSVECVFARSNASGVSISINKGELWSTPTQTYTVAVLAMDGGELACFNRRNVVNTISGSRNEVHIVPTDLRVPYLTNATVMF